MRQLEVAIANSKWKKFEAMDIRLLDDKSKDFGSYTTTLPKSYSTWFGARLFVSVLGLDVVV